VVLCRSGLAGKPSAATAYPTYCSGSRATTCNGTGGERHLPLAAPVASQSVFVATSPPTKFHSRGEIRRTLRERRRALAPNERRIAQKRITRKLSRLAAYRSARRVAVYFAIDGEVDLNGLIQDARACHKTVYVPLVAGERLRFVELPSRATLSRNRYGIPEPRGGHPIDPRKLDIVLTPLVGFDRHGTRLGMGKGYYDRSFGFLMLRRRWVRPKLVGVGFAFQALEDIAARPWDVRLWGAVTDASTHAFAAELGS
jgi:5-formyltetrahydrofolate cyclo-ligase